MCSRSIWIWRNSFDTVCHSKLIAILSRTIKDGRVISLIHKYLNSGVLIGGKKEDSPVGVPQGGPIEPLIKQYNA